MLEQIQSRITEIETAIQNLVQNHAILTGHLAEAKNFLDMATKGVEMIAPESCVSDVLEAVDGVVDAIVE
jgi:butyrate kinase